MKAKQEEYRHINAALRSGVESGLFLKNKGKYKINRKKLKKPKEQLIAAAAAAALGVGAKKPAKKPAGCSKLRKAECNPKEGCYWVIGKGCKKLTADLIKKLQKDCKKLGLVWDPVLKSCVEVVSDVEVVLEDELEDPDDILDPLYDPFEPPNAKQIKLQKTIRDISNMYFDGYEEKDKLREVLRQVLERGVQLSYFQHERMNELEQVVGHMDADVQEVFDGRDHLYKELEEACKDAQERLDEEGFPVAKIREINKGLDLDPVKEKLDFEAPPYDDDFVDPVVPEQKIQEDPERQMIGNVKIQEDCDKLGRMSMEMGDELSDEKEHPQALIYRGWDGYCYDLAELAKYLKAMKKNLNPMRPGMGIKIFRDEADLRRFKELLINSQGYANREEKDKYGLDQVQTYKDLLDYVDGLLAEADRPSYAESVMENLSILKMIYAAGILCLADEPYAQEYSDAAFHVATISLGSLRAKIDSLPAAARDHFLNLVTHSGKTLADTTNTADAHCIHGVGMSLVGIYFQTLTNLLRYVEKQGDRNAFDEFYYNALAPGIVQLREDLFLFTQPGQTRSRDRTLERYKPQNQDRYFGFRGAPPWNIDEKDDISSFRQQFEYIVLSWSPSDYGMPGGASASGVARFGEVGYDEYCKMVLFNSADNMWRYPKENGPPPKPFNWIPGLDYPTDAPFMRGLTDTIHEELSHRMYFTDKEAWPAGRNYGLQYYVDARQYYVDDHGYPGVGPSFDLRAQQIPAIDWISCNIPENATNAREQHFLDSLFGYNFSEEEGDVLEAYVKLALEKKLSAAGVAVEGWDLSRWQDDDSKFDDPSLWTDLGSNYQFVAKNILIYKGLVNDLMDIVSAGEKDVFFEKKPEGWNPKPKKEKKKKKIPKKVKKKKKDPCKKYKKRIKPKCEKQEDHPGISCEWIVGRGCQSIDSN